MKAYVLTPALMLAAFGGGYVTSLASQGVTEAKAAISQEKMHTFDAEIKNSNKTQIETWVNNVVVPYVNNELDDTIASTNNIKMLRFIWSTDDQGVRTISGHALFDLPGTWTPGEPD